MKKIFGKVANFAAWMFCMAIMSKAYRFVMEIHAYLLMGTEQIYLQSMGRRRFCFVIGYLDNCRSLTTNNSEICLSFNTRPLCVYDFWKLEPRCFERNTQIGAPWYIHKHTGPSLITMSVYIAPSLFGAYSWLNCYWTVLYFSDIAVLQEPRLMSSSKC